MVGMEWDSVCASALQTVQRFEKRRLPWITYLVALDAVLGKLGLVARHAVEVLPLGEEASGPNDLLAVAAGEAVFVPYGALVFHILITCRGEATGWAQRLANPWPRTVPLELSDHWSLSPLS